MSEEPAPYGRQYVVAVIQARLGSTRLPKKVLRPVHGPLTMMHVIHDRLRLCEEPAEIYAAIPDTPENDLLAKVLYRDGVHVIRGPEVDLVERYRRVFDQTHAAAIVRITADCCAVDYEMVDDLVRVWREDPGLDYVSNIEPSPRTFPDGLDIEVLSRNGFDKIDDLSRHGDREPITTWVWKHQERFRIATRTHYPNLGHVRWVVDTPDDLAGARVVFDRLPEGFTWQDILNEFGPTDFSVIGKC